ncbi:MAG: S9 family peptidase [Dermatophilaceae bacterium]
MPTPPVAVVRPSVRTLHGDVFVDKYAWMSALDDSPTREHLDRENAYSAEATAHLASLRGLVVEEIRSRVKETDLSVPVLDRGWWYFSRTHEGRQYPAECRVPAVVDVARPDPAPGVPLAGEQVLVDGDVEAAGCDFFALGACEVSPLEDVVAFSVDRTGDERFDVVVRRVEDGLVVDDRLCGVGYGLVWSADSTRLVYTRVDEAWRPHEVWLHLVGDDPAHDRLLLTEPDERFWLSIEDSRDGRWLLVSAGSKNTTEWWVADLRGLAGIGAPDAGPGAALVSVAGRVDGVEYDVEPCGDSVLITHNATSPDFAVDWAPLDLGGPQLAGSSERRRPWLEPVQGVRYLGVEAFAGHVLVAAREEGLARWALARPDPDGPGGWGTPEPLRVGDEDLVTLSVASNPRWDADTVRLVHESFVSPRAVVEYDVATGATEVLKRQEVPGYDPDRYTQRRDWAIADDGVAVPISLTFRADLFPSGGPGGPGLGAPPAILYGYGAYEMSLDPWFSVCRPSLLDRGVVFAVAHVRGGGEMGRSWYEQGRLGAKPTTFTDVVACARHLRERGWCAPDRLALQGGSAGGLTVGATLNLAPELFVAAHADVPFVDALTTMLDESLPLTVVERDEWGDPLHDALAYGWMRGYSPYENIRPTTYPAILATTSLHDTRVRCAEPAKWVAALRSTVTQDLGARPILLRTEMAAGHGGRSGRYDAWEQYAFEAAFLLDRLRATDCPVGA